MSTSIYYVFLDGLHLGTIIDVTTKAQIFELLQIKWIIILGMILFRVH